VEMGAVATMAEDGMKMLRSSEVTTERSNGGIVFCLCDICPLNWCQWEWWQEWKTTLPHSNYVMSKVQNDSLIWFKAKLKKCSWTSTIKCALNSVWVVDWGANFW
jgi:hypothetical protein